MTAGVGVLVVAKAPVPGLAKTRIAVDVGDTRAAEIAAACLLDTIAAVEQWGRTTDRVVALTGDLGAAVRGAEIAERLSNWVVVDQRGTTLGERIHAAHLDAGRVWNRRGITIQIGMDTPSITTTELTELAAPVLDGWTDAALGLARDGGWWGIATSGPDLVAPVSDVSMSRSDTGARTLVGLVGAGLSVGLGPVLRDVDTFDDAMVIAENIPRSHLAEVLVQHAGSTP